MALNDLTNQNIQDTYQKVVQTDGVNIADGTGSALPIKFNGPDLIVSGALRAQSYIVSESIVNVSSGSTVFGDSSDDSHTFNGNITSSGTISASGMIQTAGAISSSTGITASNALFSGNITSSNIMGDDIILNFGKKLKTLHSNGTEVDLITTAGTVQAAFSNTSVTTQYQGDIINIEADDDINMTAGGNTINLKDDTATRINFGVDSTPTMGFVGSGGISSTSDILTLSGNITASGTTFAVGRTLEVSGSATITGTGSFGHLSITQGSISSSVELITNHITASGNISASGIIHASSINNVNTTHVTASGNVSSSGNVSANTGTGSFAHISASTDLIAKTIRIPRTGYIYGVDAAGNDEALLYSGLDGSYSLGNTNALTAYIYAQNLQLNDNTGAAFMTEIGGKGLYIGGTSLANSTLVVTGSISASQGISSSGHFTGSGVYLSGDLTSLGTGSFSHLDTSGILFNHITASGDLVFNTNPSSIRASGSIKVEIESFSNAGVTTNFEIERGYDDTTLFKVDDQGFVYLYGGIVFGEGSDQSFTSDGNMTFILDYDNDETSQKFQFKNKNTELASLHESDGFDIKTAVTASGNISSSRYVSSMYDIQASELVDGGNGGAGATALDISLGISFVETDTSKSHVSLADGNYKGQFKYIIHSSLSNGVSLVVTPANFAAGTTMTSDAVGRGITLIWDGSNWHILGDVGEFVIA